MRLVTVETVTLIVVGWVLALGVLVVRHRRGEFGRRTALNWAVVACFSVGWALWQYDTLPATAETVVGTLAPWVATSLGFVGAGLVFYLYRTKPTESDDPRSEQS